MKKLALIIILLLWAGVACADEYYVYVRLEDRAGVTAEDDVGRSKAGDVVDVRPVGKTTIPGEIASKEWYIFKADLTQAQVEAMKEPWVEESIDKDEEPISIAYRKNKIDLSVLKATKPELNEIKVTPDKIELSAKTSLDLARYERNRKIDLALRPIKRHWQFWINVIDPSAFSSVACADDATDGEQICTINWASEDYDTLVLWEDAKDGDLPVAGQSRTAAVYDDDGDLATTVRIDGWQTNVTYQIKITVPEGERHNGTVGSGATLTQTFAGAGGRIILFVDDYITVEWLILEATHNTTTGDENFVFSIYHQNYITIRNNIFKYIITTSGSGSDDAYAIRVRQNTDGFTTRVYIYNNIIYGWNNPADTTWRGMRLQHNESDIWGTLYNNTVYGCDLGISLEASGGVGDDATYDVQNNIVYNNTIDFNFDVDAIYTAQNYNFSKDDTATGANSIQGDTDSKTPDFVDTTIDGGEDFHLQATSDAIDAGVDLGTGYYDIDGYDMDLAATWDIGADEYVSEAAGRSRRYL